LLITGFADFQLPASRFLLYLLIQPFLIYFVVLALGLGSFLHLLNEQAGAHPSRAVQHNGFGSHNYFLLDFSCVVCLRLQCIPLSLHFFLQP
jgi:hypothetical protein